MNTRKHLINELKNPGSEYRGAPFWAWNGKMEPDELRRQIRIMRRMGLGGFFMHARVGLDTVYLSEDWFHCVNACIDEAKKLGMQAWFYDEDRWPSGAAGGLVTRNPKYRMRSLASSLSAKPAAFVWDKDIIAAFAVVLNGTILKSCRRLAKGRGRPVLKAGEALLCFRRKIDGNSDWYNGFTYLDTMNPAAVREFIRVTYEAYRKHSGAWFGKTAPGIFTDEPNYGRLLSKISHVETDDYTLPWTGRLPEIFQQRYGYDLRDRLPELIYDLEGQAASRARYHYHDCVTHLFVTAFARQIGTWCGKNHLQFTGHVLGEETLTTQTSVAGSAMRFYEYMQAPGMDLLTEYRREYDTAKQVSSVARQFGRKWRLTETYGCTGWDFPFAGHKALGDWQAALGINLRCQHLSWYTMLGQAKRDYPAGIFFQSPWWELYPKVEDYFARIHAVMTRGHEVRDLLVIHPLESMWLLCRAGWDKDPEAKSLDQMMIKTRDMLLAEHLDFDYGDEDILARHGKVQNGAQAELAVNKARYRVVLVPPLRTIRSSTLALLRRFKQAGGQIVFAGDAPKLVDAAPSGAAQTFAADCRQVPLDGAGLTAALSAGRRVSIADEAGREIKPALYLLREDDEANYLFICNTSLSPEQWKTSILDASMKSMVIRRKTAFPKVTVSGFAGSKGHPLEVDPETGNVFAAEAKFKNGQWNIFISLPALASRLFVIPKRREKNIPPKRKSWRTVRTHALAGNSWPIRLTECNALALDRPAFKIGDGKTRGPEEILRVDKAVRVVLRVPHRGGAMKQPWARETPKHPERAPITLTYTFDAEIIPGGGLFLALEKPEMFQVAVNGMALSMEADCGWWVDPSLRKIPLAPSFIRKGVNIIIAHCDYDETFSGLEIMYLLGNFGTRVHGTKVFLTAPVTKLRIGDWVRQGLAFYSGSVNYSTTITPKLGRGERLFVRVPDYRGAAVRVHVNHRPAGIIAWEPQEIDVTGFLKPGANELGIEVVGHRRNSHGPLHHADKWTVWVGPGEYQTSGAQWMDGYNLVPCGLMTAPELVVKR